MLQLRTRPNVCSVSRLSPRFFSLIALTALARASLAQETDSAAAAAAPESILLRPSESVPTVNTDVLEEPVDVPPPAENAAGTSSWVDPLLEVPMSDAPYTSRNYVGLALSFANTGVTRGLFKISEDEILQGKVSERSWGMGLILDLGWNEESASSFRMKWGLNRVSVGLSDELRAEHGPDTLEESLNVLSLDFLLRDVLPSDDADLWWGAGFALRNAWSSHTAGSGSGRISRLRHSTALSPILSIGSDMPLERGHHLVLQADWLLIKAYQLSIGLRTQL